MRLGNLLHLFAVIILFRFINVEYQHSKNVIERELQYLRVQKSYQNRQSFEAEYGPNWKQVIVQKTEENKQLLITLWNNTMYKIIAVFVLLIISLAHFIRYFYIHDDDNDENSETMLRYNLQTWLFNFIFIWIAIGWSIVSEENENEHIILGGYVLTMFSLAYCVHLLSSYIGKKQITRFTFVRFLQYCLAILLYFHLAATYLVIAELYPQLSLFRIPIPH